MNVNKRWVKKAAPEYWFIVDETKKKVYSRGEEKPNRVLHKNVAGYKSFQKFKPICFGYRPPARCHQKDSYHNNSNIICKDVNKLIAARAMG